MENEILKKGRDEISGEGMCNSEVFDVCAEGACEFECVVECVCLCV